MATPFATGPHLGPRNFQIATGIASRDSKQRLVADVQSDRSPRHAPEVGAPGLPARLIAVTESGKHEENIAVVRSQAMKKVAVPAERRQWGKDNAAKVTLCRDKPHVVLSLPALDEETVIDEKGFNIPSGCREFGIGSSGGLKTEAVAERNLDA